MTTTLILRMRGYPGSTDSVSQYRGEYSMEVAMQQAVSLEGDLEKGVLGPIKALLWKQKQPFRLVDESENSLLRGAVMIWQSVGLYNHAATTYLCGLKEGKKALSEWMYSQSPDNLERLMRSSDTLDQLMENIHQSPTLSPIATLVMPTVAYIVAKEYEQLAKSVHEQFGKGILDYVNEKLMRDTIKFFETYGNDLLADKLRGIGGIEND